MSPTMSGTARSGSLQSGKDEPKSAGASTTSDGNKRFTRLCSDAAANQLSIHLRIGRPSQEFSLSGAAHELVSFHHDSSARKNDVRHACDLYAFEHRVVHAHVMRGGANGVLALGVENHQVGVAAYSDRSLARIKAEEFCWGRRNQLDEPVGAEAPAGNASGVNQAHAMLYARTSVGNFREVVAAHFFLFFEAERTMIGGDHLQVVALKAVPEPFLMPLLAQRRCENVLRSLETRRVKVLERKIQILRAGLGVYGQSAVARLAHFFERLVAAQVHNVDGRSRHFRQRDGARCGLSLGRGWACECVILRRLLPL